jgi:hypothetical protein
VRSEKGEGRSEKGEGRRENDVWRRIAVASSRVGAATELEHGRSDRNELGLIRRRVRRPSAAFAMGNGERNLFEHYRGSIEHSTARRPPQTVPRSLFPVPPFP